MSNNGKEVSSWQRKAEEESKAEAGSAICRADHVHATLRKFTARVEHSLYVIRQASEVGPVGVSFSGGKDSTVLVDLVRQVLPEAPVAFFDSGAELSDTYAMVAHVGAETIHPRLTMPEMARYAGWWGYRNPVDPSCGFDAKEVLIQEPSETFVVKRGLRVLCHGVRGDESRGRMMHTASRGELYRGRDGTWYCMPLARWTTQDVWSYIASRSLRYHSAYDALTDAGIERQGQRIGGTLGERGSGFGRHAKLEIADPETWSRLVAEFPAIGLQ